MRIACRAIFFSLLVSVNIFSAEKDKNREAAYRLQYKYYVTINWNFSHMAKDINDFSITKLDKKDENVFEGVLNSFEEEFNKYPVEFVRNSGIKIIIFGKNLNRNGRIANGRYTKNDNCLWFNIEDGGVSPRTLHHEFFHLIDVFFKGKDMDEEWLAAGKKSPSGGFVTDYARIYGSTVVMEDRAALFSALMIKKSANKAYKDAETDTALKAKITLLKKFVYEKCSKEMDDAYWRNFTDYDLSKEKAFAGSLKNPFDLVVFSPNPYSREKNKEDIKISRLPKNSSVKIVDNKLEVIREFEKNEVNENGQLLWDGKDRSGNVLKEGKYAFNFVDDHNNDKKVNFTCTKTFILISAR
ncbi:MAG: hypothetical protein A2231_13185 [Candidatus Firestonebacteria bacterium RIFOXYA2_FULL_40_8]|nr:MAG: hypothetical protein A2231_13185 [Candidatus Firestonebacteria bacterium RIFOXYA2_FULL_40_8]